MSIRSSKDSTIATIVTEERNRQTCMWCRRKLQWRECSCVLWWGAWLGQAWRSRMPAKDIIDLKCPSALVSSYWMKRVSDHAFAYYLCPKVKLMQRDSCHVYVIRPKSKLLRQRLDFLSGILQSYLSGLSTNPRIESSCNVIFLCRGAQK